MFGIFFFMPAITLLVLAIIFTLAISYVEKIPKAVSLTIGNLNADDICRLDSNSRNYLKKQMILHFLFATITTFLMGIIFVILVNPNHPLLVLPCVLIETAIGLIIVLSVIKKVNILKKIENNCIK